jgi:hypothetical protein
VSVDAPSPGSDDFNPKNHFWDGKTWWSLDRQLRWSGSRWLSRDDPDPPVTTEGEEPLPTPALRSLRAVDRVAIATTVLVLLLASTVDLGMVWAKNGGPFDPFLSLYNLLPVAALIGLAVGAVALAVRPKGAYKWPAVMAIVLSPLIAGIGWMLAFSIVWSGLS